MMLGSNKHAKISNGRQLGDADGVDISGMWLPDGVLFNILSYTYDTDLLD